MDLYDMQDFLEVIYNSNLKNIRSIKFDIKNDVVIVIYKYDNGFVDGLRIDKRNRTCGEYYDPSKWICNNCKFIKECINGEF